MLIKKIIFLPIFTLLTSIFPVICLSVDISASCAVVINAQTKEIIYEKNAHKRASMASTTKIMTGIIAIESGRLSNRVVVTNQALTEGTSIGLREGNILSLEALVYGMLLESGNDAANACALFLGGDFDSFADIMNAKAREIGMKNTNFVTPSGLDDDMHYSTAYDMSLLGSYCITNPIFREICSERNKEIRFIRPDTTAIFSNHNKLLDMCEGVFGIKTGFTKKSGRCLVSACERDGATLVCVTLNASDDWNDHCKLYDSSFSELNRSVMKPSFPSEIAVYGGSAERLRLYCEDCLYFFKENSELKRKVVLPAFIYAPVKKNDILGRVIYYSGDTAVHTSYIYSADEVALSEKSARKKKNLFDRLKELFSY